MTLNSHNIQMTKLPFGFYLQMATLLIRILKIIFFNVVENRETLKCDEFKLLYFFLD